MKVKHFSKDKSFVASNRRLSFVTADQMSPFPLNRQFKE